MKAKIIAKTQAAADTTIKNNKEVYTALEAKDWRRIALPPIGRDMSITSDFIIMDKAEPLSIYGEYDGVYFEQKEEPVIDQVIHMNTDNSKKKMQMGDISVIKAMRLNSPSINIAVDTEYYDDESGTRNILSWQFCFITNDRMLHKVIVFSQCGKLLELNKVLSFLIEYFDLYKPFMKEAGLKFRPLRCWEVPVKDSKGRFKKTVFDNFDEAVEQCSDKVLKQKLINIGANTKAPYDTSAMYREGFFYDYREADKNALSVTLLMHFANADLTTFGLCDDSGKDVLTYCSAIQGGLVTLKPVLMHIKTDQSYGRFFPIKLSVRDTMCFAPGNKKKLDDLGGVIGFKKMLLPEGYTKDKMKDFLIKKPDLFAIYASTDSAITLLYASKLWGVNSKMPITISSAACSAAVRLLKKQLGLKEDDTESFDRIYRGVKKVSKGLKRSAKTGRFTDNNDLEPINMDTKIIQDACADAYQGGYNASSKIGYFYGTTYDYDLKNAYPTAMAAVKDIDWENPIKEEYRDIDVTLKMYDSPVEPIIGYVKFEFPEDVKYPSIPAKVDGCMVLTRTSGDKYLYAMGPEIYTALKLGAKVHADRLIKANPRKDKYGLDSHFLKDMVKAFVEDRSLAKKLFGDESVEQLIIKIAVNSLYGKTAQNIMNKRSWSAEKQQMESIGASALTSPYHAAMTTSIVRCLLISAMNQVESKGYKASSSTTDGFITNAPFEVLDSLDLLGFKAVFESARIELTGKKDMWETKHIQEELLNISTRGNVGINRKSNSMGCFDDIVNDFDDQHKGVLAHNGYRTGETEDTLKDRLIFVQRVLERNGKIECIVPVKTPFKQLSAAVNREDFRIKYETKWLSMDFDLKRKPVRESLYTEKVTINGVEYELACFETVPYKDVEEYLLYKKIGRNSTVLKTVPQWQAFFERVNRDASGEKSVTIRDYEKRRLQSCVMAIVQGVEIKALGGQANVSILLDKDVSVSKKLNFINQFNKGSTVFSNEDWRNCRRKDRLYQLLPEPEFTDLLQKMIATNVEK